MCVADPTVYYELRRNTVPDLGSAEWVVTSTDPHVPYRYWHEGSTFTDVPSAPGIYYYWVRAIAATTVEAVDECTHYRSTFRMRYPTEVKIGDSYPLTTRHTLGTLPPETYEGSLIYRYYEDDDWLGAEPKYEWTVSTFLIPDPWTDEWTVLRDISDWETEWGPEAEVFAWFQLNYETYEPLVWEGQTPATGYVVVQMSSTLPIGPILAGSSTAEGVELNWGTEVGTTEFNGPLELVWPDCNGNDIPDDQDIADCTGEPWCGDCNGNDIPDECDIDSGASQDLNNNEIPDECEDCNGNGVPDDLDIAYCDGSAWCSDCNGNSVLDVCDITDGTSLDLDGNGIPDECEMPPATLFVDDDAPGDPAPGDPSVSDPLEDGTSEHPFDAIQEAINVAVDGDIIELADGTYTGTGNKNLNFDGKAITVRSAHTDPSLCIIDCQGSGYGFSFSSGEASDSVIRGLTITNGVATSGGAVLCTGSSPSLTNCTITGNLASGAIFAYGGGVSCLSSSSPTLTNCTITGNSASGANNTYGGGMYCYSSSPTLTNCTITGNSANGTYSGYGGGVCCLSSSLTLNNCAITGNSVSGTSNRYGGGVCCSSSSLTLINCVISENSAGYGGGVSCFSDSPTLTNCILWNNTPQEIHGSGPVLTYCCVEGGSGQSWFGEGCVDADPQFIDPDGPDNDPSTWQDNDYHLSAGSPCIDAGDNTAVPPDTWDLDGDGDVDEPLPLDLLGQPRFADDPDAPDTGNPDGVNPLVDMGAYEGSVPAFQDCNSNGVPDTDDIASTDPDGDGWVSADCNLNGVPDECEHAVFISCLAGPDTVVGGECLAEDLDADADVDLHDFALFQSECAVPSAAGDP